MLACSPEATKGKWWNLIMAETKEEKKKPVKRNGKKKNLNAWIIKKIRIRRLQNHRQFKIELYDTWICYLIIPRWFLMDAYVSECLNRRFLLCIIGKAFPQTKWNLQRNLIAFKCFKPSPDCVKCFKRNLQSLINKVQDPVIIKRVRSNLHPQTPDFPASSHVYNRWTINIFIGSHDSPKFSINK